MELTPQERAEVEVVRQKWVDIFFSSYLAPQEELEICVGWLYGKAGRKAPKVIVAQGPEDAQRIAREITGQNIQHSYSYYGNAGDCGWIAYGDYFQQKGIQEFEDFDMLMRYAKCGIWDAIQLGDYCIIVRKPMYIHVDENNSLHCATGPAIEFLDGTKLYVWHSTKVPANVIENPDSITAQDLIGETNAEVKRAMMQILGVQRFMNILDVELIDEDVDDEGKPMSLHRTKAPDPVTRQHIYFYKCVDASTDKPYILTVPPKNMRNVWDAKAWMFSMKKYNSLLEA